MEKIFLEVLRLSVLSGAMVLVVLVMRPFLKKIPKSLCCILWMLVGIRMMIPFSINSVFALFPEQVLPGQMFLEQDMLDARNSGGEAGKGEEALAFSQSVAGQGAEEKLPDWGKDGISEKQSADVGLGRLQDVLRVGSWIWCAGMLLMSAYFLYSWFKIRACVQGAKQSVYSLESKEGRNAVKIFWSDGIETPFLFGIWHPKIYVPLPMDQEDLPYILRHELMHKKRRDYIVKPAAFLLLAIHWFNPFIWIAYKMLCKDIELACDEMVIRDMAVKDRKAYSRALLNCSVWKEKAAAVPVAFGELSVRERIKNILNYRKPTAWVIGLGVILGAALLFCFMTQRKMMGGQSILLANETGGVKEREAETESNEIEDLDIRGLDEESGRLAVQERELDLVMEDERSLSHVKAWAEAFCDRDGKTIVSLCSEELLDTLKEEETIMAVDGEEVSFGWSSPWPWDQETDYRVVDVTDSTARVLYYAWTSDPHVTVWEEKLAWRTEGERYVMDHSELTFWDNICSGEEFYSAYPEGSISDTRMDYLNNGTGEALNENAKENPDIYEPLFAPDTATRFLLNLLNNDEKVEVVAEEEEAGKAQVTIRFILDHTEIPVNMIQPYGEDGIWIPQTWEK